MSTVPPTVREFPVQIRYEDERRWGRIKGDGGARTIVDGGRIGLLVEITGSQVDEDRGVRNRTGLAAHSCRGCATGIEFHVKPIRASRRVIIIDDGIIHRTRRAISATARVGGRVADDGAIVKGAVVGAAAEIGSVADNQTIIKRSVLSGTAVHAGISNEDAVVGNAVVSTPPRLNRNFLRTCNNSWYKNSPRQWCYDCH